MHAGCQQGVEERGRARNLDRAVRQLRHGQTADDVAQQGNRAMSNLHRRGQRVGDIGIADAHPDDVDLGVFLD